MPDLRNHPTTHLCRIEFRDPATGTWSQRGGDVALLRPEAVPGRYAAHGKSARCTELGPDLSPTGRVWALADGVCPVCDATHPLPHDGSCLIGDLG